MHDSARALLSGIVDYAGLFPPARLELAPAIENFARYRESADAWMLGRFICPAPRLVELDAHADILARGATPFEFSVLGRPARGRDEFLHTFAADLADTAAFAARHRGRVAAPQYEVRIPDEVLSRGEAGPVAALLRELARIADDRARAPFAPFFEAATGGAWEELVPAVVAGIAEHNRRHDARVMEPPGFKLRCGGTEAAAFPPAGQVARALAATARHEVRIKFTAGLHHPAPRFDDAAGARMFGFLAVYAGAILASTARIPETDLVGLLASDNPRAIAFHNGGIEWNGHRAGTGQIASLRASRVSTFGSCSFDEPRTELRELGVID